MLEPPINLPGRVHVQRDADAVHGELVEVMRDHATDAIDQRGAFHLALSGGSAPVPLFERLVTDPDLRDFPWPQTHIWQVDERRVPEGDERANMAMLCETLLDHVDIPTQQIHSMPVMEDDPATLYQGTLRKYISESDDPPRLDFILLGIGGDCHTASLFPHSAAIDVVDRWITVNDDQAVTPPPRVTMTYPTINAGRYVAVLVTGRKKADALKRVEAQNEQGGPDPTELPITGVQPAAGPLHWYLDEDAVKQEM